MLVDVLYMYVVERTGHWYASGCTVQATGMLVDVLFRYIVGRTSHRYAGERTVQV